MNYLKFIAVSLIMIFLTSCDERRRDDTLIIGTSADNPPYEFIQDGKVVGLDIDIINAIANKLDKKLVIKNLDFNGLLAALTSKNLDLVIAALSNTAERREKVDFSDTYMTTTIAILYRTKEGVDNKYDLMGKSIGAQLGSTWGGIAKDLTEKYNGKVHLLSNNLMLVKELTNNKIDAVIVEEVQAKKFLANNKELSYFILEDFSSEFAIAFPKGSNLKASIDKVLKELTEDGSLEKIRKKWLEQ